MGTARTTSVEETAPQPEVVAERAGGDGAGGPVACPIALMWEALERLLPYVESVSLAGPAWREMLANRDQYSTHRAVSATQFGRSYVYHAVFYAWSATVCLSTGSDLGYENALFYAREALRYAEGAEKGGGGVSTPTYEEMKRYPQGRAGHWPTFVEQLVPGEVTEVDVGARPVKSVRTMLSHAARTRGIPVITRIIDGRLYVARLKPDDANKRPARGRDVE